MAEHVLQRLEVSDEDGVETEGVHVHEPVLLMLLVHPPQCPHRVCASLAAKLVEDFENVVRLNLKDDIEQNYESNILIKRMDCQQKTVVVHKFCTTMSSLPLYPWPMKGRQRPGEGRSLNLHLRLMKRERRSTSRVAR